MRSLGVYSASAEQKIFLIIIIFSVIYNGDFAHDAEPSPFLLGATSQSSSSFWKIKENIR